MPVRSRTRVLADLTALTTDLASQREEMAELLAAELTCKEESFWRSEEETIKGRERVADYNALNLSTDIIKLRGQILANEDRRVLLLEELHYATVSD